MRHSRYRADDLHFPADAFDQLMQHLLNRFPSCAQILDAPMMSTVFHFPVIKSGSAPRS